MVWILSQTYADDAPQLGLMIYAWWERVLVVLQHSYKGAAAYIHAKYVFKIECCLFDDSNKYAAVLDQRFSM